MISPPFNAPLGLEDLLIRYLCTRHRAILLGPRGLCVWLVGCIPHTSTLPARTFEAVRVRMLLEGVKSLLRMLPTSSGPRPSRPYTKVFNTWLLGRPEIVDFGSPGGPGGPGWFPIGSRPVPDELRQGPQKPNDVPLQGGGPSVGRMPIPESGLWCTRVHGRPGSGCMTRVYPGPGLHRDPNEQRLWGHGCHLVTPMATTQ
jgi:hypothetical protein